MTKNFNELRGAMSKERQRKNRNEAKAMLESKTFEVPKSKARRTFTETIPGVFERASEAAP